MKTEAEIEEKCREKDEYMIAHANDTRGMNMYRVVDWSKKMAEIRGWTAALDWVMGRGEE